MVLVNLDLIVFAVGVAYVVFISWLLIKGEEGK
jgi:hypothetical protein